jgi:hypothetical protein
MAAGQGTTVIQDARLGFVSHAGLSMMRSHWCRRWRPGHQSPRWWPASRGSWRRLGRASQPPRRPRAWLSRPGCEVSTQSSPSVNGSLLHQPDPRAEPRLPAQVLRSIERDVRSGPYRAAVGDPFDVGLGGYRPRFSARRRSATPSRCLARNNQPTNRISGTRPKPGRLPIHITTKTNATKEPAVATTRPAMAS